MIHYQVDHIECHHNLGFTKLLAGLLNWPFLNYVFWIPLACTPQEQN